MNIFAEKAKFEKFLLSYQIQPLTVAYHGSLFHRITRNSDIDVVLIVQAINPLLFKKLSKISKRLNAHLGISVVSVREAGTIFGGLKYLDALCRHYGYEEKYPYAYYKIAALNEQFRRNAVEMNVEKCKNIAKLITKTMNNFLGSELSITDKTFDSLVASIERNLKFFYDHEQIKVGKYREKVRVVH